MVQEDSTQPPLFLKGSRMNYTLRTDRNVAPEPPLPTLGPAGSLLTDAEFKTRIIRVTDEAFSTSIGAPRRSWMSGSGGEQNTWARDTSAFIVQGLGGEWVPFSLTGKLPTPNNHHGLPINGPAFSYNNPLLIYGRAQDDRALVEYDLQSMKTQVVVSFPSVAVGEVSPSANDRVACYGKGGQDFATEVYLWDGSKLRTLDTVSGKVDGSTLNTSGVQWGFGVHNVRLDKSGRFAVITPSQLLAQSGATLVVWDIDNGRVFGLSTAAGGHKVGGYGYLVNQDVASDGSAWDDMQFVIRNLDGQGPLVNLIKPVMRPARDSGASAQLGQDCHLSWNNAQAAHEPVLVSGYRLGNSTDVWRPWDNEIILVATDGSGTVYRACHHRTKYEHFWDGPHAVISPDGTQAVFTSNWGKSLGVGEDGEARRDVFRVELAASGIPAPIPPPLPTQPTPSPDGTKSNTITDLLGQVWTLGKKGETLRDGVHMADGFGKEYKFVGGVVYVRWDSTWYRWDGARWVVQGQQEPGGVSPNPVPVSPTPPATGTRYEHDTSSADVASMNAKGAQGWELITVVSGLAWFRRVKP